MVKQRKTTSTVNLDVAYLDQCEGRIVYTQEGERLGKPEAQDDEGSLQ